MSKKISILGVGPMIARVTIAYAAILVLIIEYFKIEAKISVEHHTYVYLASIVLIAIGLPYLLLSALSLKKAYSADKLCAKGAYSICRHPLYSAWTFFIIPGGLLFFNSWLLLSIPIVMYVAFRVFIKKEEIYLEDRFGEDYIKYKNEVGLLFPKFWKYKKL